MTGKRYEHMSNKEIVEENNRIINQTNKLINAIGIIQILSILGMIILILMKLKVI